jgi:hypothetical protein
VCRSAESSRPSAVISPFSVSNGSMRASRREGIHAASPQDVTITSRLAAYATRSKTWTVSGISAAKAVAIRTQRTFWRLSGRNHDSERPSNPVRGLHLSSRAAFTYRGRVLLSVDGITAIPEK